MNEIYMDDIYIASNTAVGGGGAQQTSATTAQPAQTSSSSMSFLANPNTQLLVTMVIVFGIMYLFTIRPQRKREKELKEIQSRLQAGDWVVTFSGMFGKVVDVGDNIIMVEFGTNKGVRIPVRKSEVTKTTEPVITVKKEEEEPAPEKKKLFGIGESKESKESKE